MAIRLSIAKIEVPGIDAHLNPEVAQFDTYLKAWERLCTERRDDEFDLNEECNSPLAQTLCAISRDELSASPLWPARPAERASWSAKPRGTSTTKARCTPSLSK